MRQILFLIVALGFTACASHKVQTYERIAPHEKTMTIEPGSYGPMGYIKSALREAGWKLHIAQGPEVTEKNPTQDVHYDTFHSRYRLYIDFMSDGGIQNSSLSRYFYDISVMDTKTGFEVITLTGRRALSSQIAEELLKALKSAED